jgi:hypothetical protein
VVHGADWRTLKSSASQRRERRARATGHGVLDPVLVSFISRVMTIEAGDLIATGPRQERPR